MVEDGPIRIKFIDAGSDRATFKFVSFPKWARAQYGDYDVNPITEYRGWRVASWNRPLVHRATGIIPNVLWCPGKDVNGDDETLVWENGVVFLNMLIAKANAALARDALAGGRGEK